MVISDNKETHSATISTTWNPETGWYSSLNTNPNWAADWVTTDWTTTTSTAWKLNEWELGDYIHYLDSHYLDSEKIILKNKTKEEKKEMLKIIDVKIGYEKRAVVDKTKRDANGNYLAHKEEFPVTTIVTFENKRTQTAYCDKDDTFNLETGITICVAKELMQRLYGENKDNNLNKIIRSGLHLYKKLDKLAQKVSKQLEEDERIEKNRKAKEQKRRLKRAEKKKEREIEILAEAIRRANADSK